MPGEWLWTLRMSRMVDAVHAARWLQRVRAADILRYERTGEGLHPHDLAELAARLKGLPAKCVVTDDRDLVKARRVAVEYQRFARLERSGVAA